MLKSIKRLLLIAALLVPWVTNAQTTVTVADGTATNGYIPVYGFYADDDQHNQIVYPASMLSDLSGGMITGMTFYMSSPASSAWGGSATISIMEVSGTTVTSILPTTGATEVWTGTVNGNTSTWAITFTTPYTYGGGNLLIDIDYVTAGSYSSCSWTGVSQTGGSYCTYGSSSYAEDFLPKVTFEYAPAGDFCFAPRNLTGTRDESDIDFTWIDTNNTNSSWIVAWGPRDFNPDTVVNNTDVTTTQAYSLTNLDDGQYTFAVRANCGTDSSAWVYFDFNIGVDIINMSITGVDTLTTCNAIIYDDGGPTGSYAAYCQSTLVIRPGQEDVMLRITGQSYTESTYDYLRIYEGVGTSGELLFDDYGVSATQTFGPFEADAFTVVFNSDGSVFYDGFQINAVCIDIPDCSRPSDFTVTSVTHDSVYFSWVDSVNSNWTIGYGPAGFDFDTCNTFVDFTETYGEIGELSPNTPYDFYLMAVCSGDTSWFRMLTARTTCVPVDSLPWSQNFESEPTGSESTGSAFPFCMTRLNNGTSYGGYPYVSSSSSYNHTPGGSKGLYWYNTNTTGTYGDYQIVVMPGLDPEFISLDTVQFKFWAKSSSTSYFPDFQVGVMTNPNDPASFTQVASINVDNSTQWAEYTVPLGTYEGTGRYIALRALRSSDYWYAYVDDLTIEAVPSCPPVVDLTVGAVTTQYASLQWDYMRGILEDAPDSYTVELVEVDSTNSPTTLTTSDPYIVLSGLTPGTHYKAYVSVSCSDGDGAADSVEFSTTSFGCAEADTNSADTVYFSNSSTGQSGCLANSAWGNTAYQTIYTAEELIAAGLAAGPITAIDLGFTASSSYAKEFTIFMGNTATTSISNATFEDPSQHTQVYGPEPHPTGTSGWQHYDFTAPFVWDGSSSIIMTTFMNQPQGQSQSSSSGLTGYYVSASNTSRYRYQDSNPFTLSNLTGGNSGSTYSYRAAIHFYSIECMTPSTCAAPAAWVSNVTRDSVSIEWLPGAEETSWNLYVDSLGTMVYVATTTDTYYDFSGLNASTDYKFYVENVCDDDSLICFTTATTLPDDAWDVLPFVCTFDSTNMDGVWQRVNNNQTNKWYIGMAGDSRALMISDNGTTNTYNVSSTSASHAYARINLPAGEYAYSFDWRAVGESSLDYILAYIVPDSYTPAAGSYSIPGNAIRIDGGSYLNQSSTWQTRSDIINIADSGVYKVVFTWRNDGSVGTMPPAGIDNVMFARNTCPRPASITLDSVTTTTATFHWVDSSTTTTGGYKIEYNGIVDYTTNTSYTATNLNPSTGYTFRVSSICDLDDTSMAITINAFTACGDVMVPYFEDFESFTASSTTFPQCWTNFSNTSNYVQASYGVSSSNALHFAGPGVVVTPRIAIPGNHMVLSCYLRAESTASSGSMHIGFTTNPTTLSDYVEITEIQPNTTLTYYSDIYFDSATSDTGYVVFKQDPNASTIYYWWLDEVNIIDMGTCPRPNNLSATNATTNSVDLSWNDRGNPQSWVIEYGPAGFTPGTGTTVAASSNPFTLTGIPASYQGEFYVRAVCGGGDSSDYCTTPGRFSTTQVPATLPYTYDFENDAEWANWQTSSNVATNWYRGTAVANGGSYSMYVSADQGATYKPYNNNAVVNAAVYRDIDFGSTQSSFTISFDARVGGTISAYYDGLMVFLVDPAIPTVASDASITSPWGNVNDLYRIATVRLDTVWHTHSASFDTISGIKRVAFFWFNQNTGANYPALLEPAAIDNIHIEESACPRPLATSIDAVGATTASISWMGPSPATYEVIYRPYPNGTSNTYVQTQTNSIVLTGLEPMTQYAVWVRKLCTGDTSLTSDGVLFTTDMCDNAVTVTNFDTTMSPTTSSYSPIGYSTYNYSYVQTIIDSAQLAEITGDITAFAFSAASTSAGTYFTNMTVYMANIPDSISDLSSSFIHPSTDIEFVKVIDGADFSYSEVGMQFHGFDTVFTWDGHSNILFSVAREHGSWTSGSSFNAHTQTSGKMRYVYQDSGPYDYMTVSGGSTSSAVGDIYLISCGGGCAKPTLLPVTDRSYNTATVNWNSNATDFEVTYKAVTDGVWPAEIAVSNATSYVINNLSPATEYQYRVRAICDATENLVSDWVSGTFVTDSLPCFVPTDLHTTNVGYTSASLAWNASSEQNHWTLTVWNTAGAVDYDVTGNAAYTVSGLTQDNQYYAAVKAVCGNGAAESEYSDTIQFTTDNCEQVTGVTVTNITENSAVVSWQAATATSYEVDYGPVGHGQGQGTTVTVNGVTTYTITGLESETGYSVYVRALCEADAPGPWSQVQEFTTLEGGIGIDVADGMNVSIYPNPTSSTTTIALSGVNGDVAITVVDMNGRVVMSDSMSCEGDCVKTMEVSGLAQGAYFVRINGENVNMVKKLVVK